MASLWSSLLERRVNGSGGGLESTLIVCGDAGAGKRSLLKRLNGSMDVSSPSAETLGYTFLEARLSDSSTEDEARAKINAWIAGDPECGLLGVALPPAAKLRATAAVVVLDLSRPWLLLSALERWIHLLRDEVKERLADAPQGVRAELDDANCRLARLGVDSDETATESASQPATDPSSEYFAVPLVVVGCKSDVLQTNASPEHQDFIQSHLRRVCLRYGAALVYASPRTGKNCDSLREYILCALYRHRSMRFSGRPEVQERDAILVPAGWDSTEMIAALTPGTSKWKDATFESVITPPEAAAPRDSQATVISAMDEQAFLSKLQGMQKFTIGSVVATRSAAPTTTSTEELLSPSSKPPAKGGVAASAKVSTQDAKDNPALIANFFQSLLSKGKTGQGGSAETRAQAEQALEELKRGK